MADLLGVIFDMDGVLVDSEPLHAQAWQDTLGPYGLHYSRDDFAAWIGVPDRVFAEMLVTDRHLPCTGSALVEAKRERFRALVSLHLQPFPGIKARLPLLQARYCLAVATGSAGREARHALTVTGLLPHLAAVVCNDEVHHGKPHPEPYLTAAAKLGLAPPTCAALEDSVPGVASAVAAGCVVLGIATTMPFAALTGAHHVFPTTLAALEWLLLPA